MKNQHDHSNAAFLWELNQFLSNRPDIEKHIPAALKRLGEHEKADVVCIVDINHDTSFSISHLWNTDHQAVQMPADFKDRIFLFNKKLEELLGKEYYIHVSADEEPVNQGLKNIVDTLQAQQAIFLPMTISSHLFSFLVFGIKSDKAWTPSIDFLINSGTIISGVIERETALSRLLKHQLLYQDFIENRMDFLLRIDKNLNISFANKRFLKLFEKTQNEINACKFDDLIPDTIQYIPHFEKLRDSPENIITFEAPVVTTDSVIYIEWNIYAIHTSSDNYEYHVVGHDVTTHREEALALNHILEELWTKSGGKNK